MLVKNIAKNDKFDKTTERVDSARVNVKVLFLLSSFFLSPCFYLVTLTTFLGFLLPYHN